MEYVAMKDFQMLGHQYRRGDKVDVTKLPAHKVSQFLNQRLIRPAGAGQ